MEWFRRTLLVTATALLSISYLPSLFGTWPSPRLILAAIIVLSLESELGYALAWALVGGLFLDMAQPGQPWFMLTYCGLVFLIVALTQRGVPSIFLVIGALLIATLMEAGGVIHSGLLISLLVNGLTLGGVWGQRRWLTNRSVQRHNRGRIRLAEL